MTPFLRLRTTVLVAVILPALAACGHAAPRQASPRVLMIGDSLSAGPFGQSIEQYLETRLGRSNFALFGSCGSSPENWLRAEPDYYTKCGFREDTPERHELIDFQDGRRPPRVRTPKVEDLIARYRPTAIIVQLGTNWMDPLMKPRGNEEQKFSGILDRFAIALRSPPNLVRQVIWIMPPDATAYTPKVQATVAKLIKNIAKKNNYTPIDSSRMTHYVRGKTGGDGVHYNKDAAKAWADQVTRKLDRLIR
jgi:hypothetical protein